MNEQGAPASRDWLDADERAFFEASVAKYRAHLDSCGVKQTPFLDLRIGWLATLEVLQERNLDALAEAALRKPTQPECAKAFNILVDALIKNWERIQKTVNETEEYCAKAGTPIDKGLADKVKPLLQRTEGVIESLLAGNGPRPRKRAGKKAVDKTAVMDRILEP